MTDCIQFNVMMKRFDISSKPLCREVLACSDQQAWVQAGALRGKSLCGSKRAEVFLGALLGFCCVVQPACMQNKAPELGSDPNAIETSHNFCGLQ